MVYSPEKNGKRLRKLRIAKGKTTTEAAYELNISESALRAYESGARNPSDDVKIDIAQYYKVSVESIFFAH